MIETPQKRADFVDRKQRLDLAKLLRDFLDDRITMFELGVALEPFHQSQDRVIGFVLEEISEFYDDDLEARPVAITKTEWDYNQRLLLLLESGHTLHTTVTQRSSWTQLVALLALSVFAATANAMGWGPHLLFVSIPAGIVSILLVFLWPVEAVGGPYRAIVEPFASFADLRSTYIEARFQKMRYPRERLEERLAISPLGEFVCILLFCGAWILLSPIVLAFQAWPHRDCDVRVVTK